MKKPSWITSPDVLTLIVIALVLLSLLGGCAHQDEWTSQDTWMQVGVYTLMAADAYSTTNIQYDPDQGEIGPIAHHALGRQPKTSDTWQYFVVMGTLHYVVARVLPEGYRTWYQGALIAGHTHWIVNNADQGLFSKYEAPPPIQEPQCTMCQPIR